MTTHPLDELNYAPHRGDAAVLPDGSWRPEWSAAVADVAPQPGSRGAALTDTFRRASRWLDAEGAGHLVRDPEPMADGSVAGFSGRPWRLDPLPYVVTADQWPAIEAIVDQRARLVDAALRDLYGEQRLVAGGRTWVDTMSSRSNRVAAQRAVGGADADARGPSGVVHVVVDLARAGDGHWVVVQHVVDAPVGVGFALLNRKVSTRVAASALRSQRVAPLDDHVSALHAALMRSAAATEQARCVVLTGGPRHPGYVEHSLLARELGFHLVEGGDLVMRGGVLWLRALEALEPLQVVLRTLTDDELDPLETAAPSSWFGVPGLVWGARRGTVSIANPFGSALVDSESFHRLTDDACGMLLGESPRAATWHLGHPTDFETVPSFDGQRLAPGRVVLRVPACVVDGQVVVMRGGVGRVLADHDDPRQPTAERCKDVWVVGAPRPTAVVRSKRLPQVDFGGSLPRRVADAMFLLGRAVERAEHLARTIRVVHDDVRIDDDHLASWSAVAVELLGRTDGAGPVDDALHAAVGSLAAAVGDVLVESASVREYLPGGVRWVLARLDAQRVQLSAAPDPLPIDAIDEVLVQCAAFSGLLAESTVRGPGWRFGELGRRLQRCLGVVDSVQAALGPVTVGHELQSASATLLAINESLVAYRRRYRSDIEVGAVVDLLLRDETNPRSLVFQLDRIREQAVALHWFEGVSHVDRAATAAAEIPHLLFEVARSAAAERSTQRRNEVDRIALLVREHLLACLGAVHQRWLNDPALPARMGV